MIALGPIHQASVFTPQDVLRFTLLCLRPQELLTGDETFMQPASRRNEVLAWVTGGLRDFSISRAAVEWGIKIPRDESQTVYVWYVPLHRRLRSQVGVLGCR